MFSHLILTKMIILVLQLETVLDPIIVLKLELVITFVVFFLSFQFP